jgi:hypothetical protein
MGGCFSTKMEKLIDEGETFAIKEVDELKVLVFDKSTIYEDTYFEEVEKTLKIKIPVQSNECK